MKIQLKRSNQLDTGAAKEPAPAQMEYGELAVNYSTADPAIFIKKQDNSIIRIAGAGFEGSFSGDYNDLTNLPVIGNGALTIVTQGEGASASGVYSANQSSPSTLTLPTIRYQDLSGTPTIPTVGNGTITINNADGSENAKFTVNQTGDTTVTLPAGFSGDFDDLSNKPNLDDVTGQGNNSTVGITIATDKIALNADGSATFAKQITATEGYALAQLPTLL